MVVAGLALQAAALFAYGALCAWARQADGDMAARAAEYALFRNGVYPNAWLEQPPSSDLTYYTVYPPYAFPLFAFFFEPGGLVQGRFLIESLSLASLVVMGMYAYRTLISHGPLLAWVGALSGAAIAGNGTAFSLGQFSILCVGLIVQQMIFLERGRPLAAGACWALAMIKPQIAMPFLVLFLMRRQMAGGFFGAALLGALTAAACQWTGVSLGKMLDFWGRGMSLRFLEDGVCVGPGGIAKMFGIDYRTMQLIALGVMGAMLVPAVSLVRRARDVAMLSVAALCAVCGMLCFYHRHYDNIMLFPTLLAALHTAAATPSRTTVAVATAMLVSVLLPKRLLRDIPLHEAVLAITWVTAAVVPLATAAMARKCSRQE